MGKLDLDEGKINYCRQLAEQIIRPVLEYVLSHTTVSVERSVLRLLGVDGTDQNGVPLPNVMVDQMAETGALVYGAANCLAGALADQGSDISDICRRVQQGSLRLDEPPGEAGRMAVGRLAAEAVTKIASLRRERESMLARLGEGPQPWLYVIVATGNIYEDVEQAQKAVWQGADIIAVIRSTGQSLLDYVPYGPTTEGFGGTYATGANFRLMRQALDEAGETAGRYIRLTNYCSGLCMPEIAVLGAQERLDVMLSDAMYGVIFRDINMRRTFIDQHFARLVNGFAGIIINTGEDNYLTTADAFTSAHTVLASQFINERFALAAGLSPELMGLGHAYEMDPNMEDAFLFELAQAQMVREIFPEAPVKYMPPTKYLTGDIFRGLVQNTLFNAAGIISGQGIQLLGMLTEAIHTPYLQDRFLSLSGAKLVFHNMRHFGEEITFVSGGRIQRRAQDVLDQALTLLEEVARIGLWDALGQAFFADISRLPDGGRGADGVVARAPAYWNPFFELLTEKGGA